jgi:hypothetical protein
MIMIGRRRQVFGLFAAFGALALAGITASCVSPAGPGPVGTLTGRTDCKSFGAVTAGTLAAAGPGQECAEYGYDGSGLLRLKHVNAAFNCCPGAITADIEIAGGRIRIKEAESSSLCDCDCLYDLDYVFTGLDPGTYTIIIVGPYQVEGDAPLTFLVDLGGAGSGSFCVERTRYPWGIWPASGRASLDNSLLQ